MRIVFMGTPDFARESLEAVFDAGHEIACVVTNPDKPKGRGMKMIASPVKEFAESKELTVYQPMKVRNNAEFIETIKGLNPDLFVVVAYGKILPQEILKIPKYGSVNVHGSLLPKYRGAAPIQWAVLNGEEETGITTMFMDAGMDTGDMILKEKVRIREDETTGELWNELSKVGASLLIKTLEKIENASKKITSEKNSQEKIKELVGAEKQEDNYSVAPMLNKQMAKIDWNKSANEIHNLVRGLNPIMGAYAFFNGKKIKIWKTKLVNIETNRQYQSGEIISADKNGLLVSASNGIINILEIQPENKKRMSYKDFLNGNQIEAGEKFE